mmetsp:Transcript_1973/g.7513  ORF Transcript_1973/g.7513 Transcript_1973/m.7513 type:complete len:625 (+) Transcript_1973:1468-3342(+)
MEKVAKVLLLANDVELFPHGRNDLDVEFCEADRQVQRLLLADAPADRVEFRVRKDRAGLLLGHHLRQRLRDDGQVLLFGFVEAKPGLKGRRPLELGDFLSPSLAFLAQRLRRLRRPCHRRRRRILLHARLHEAGALSALKGRVGTVGLGAVGSVALNAGDLPFLDQTLIELQAQPFDGPPLVSCLSGDAHFHQAPDQVLRRQVVPIGIQIKSAAQRIQLRGGHPRDVFRARALDLRGLLGVGAPHLESFLDGPPDLFRIAGFVCNQFLHRLYCALDLPLVLGHLRGTPRTAVAFVDELGPQIADHVLNANIFVCDTLAICLELRYASVGEGRLHLHRSADGGVEPLPAATADAAALLAVAPAAAIDMRRRLRMPPPPTVTPLGGGLAVRIAGLAVVAALLAGGHLGEGGVRGEGAGEVAAADPGVHGIERAQGLRELQALVLVELVLLFLRKQTSEAPSGLKGRVWRRKQAASRQLGRPTSRRRARCLRRGGSATAAANASTRRKGHGARRLSKPQRVRTPPGKRDAKSLIAHLRFDGSERCEAAARGSRAQSTAAARRCGAEAALAEAGGCRAEAADARGRRGKSGVARRRGRSRHEPPRGELSRAQRRQKARSVGSRHRIGH